MILRENIQTDECDCFVLFKLSSARPLHDLKPAMSLQYSGILMMRRSSATVSIHRDLPPMPACHVTRKHGLVAKKVVLGMGLY